MNILYISFAISILIILIAIFNKSKEGFQTRPAPTISAPVAVKPAEIDTVDKQLVSMSNTLLSSLKTYSSLITKRKDIEQRHVEKGGNVIPYPPVVQTLLKTIQPQ